MLKLTAVAWLPLVTLQVRERFTHVVEGVCFPKVFLLEVVAQESSSLESDVPTERSPINSGQKGWLGSQVGSVPFGSERSCMLVVFKVFRVTLYHGWK